MRTLVLDPSKRGRRATVEALRSFNRTVVAVEDPIDALRRIRTDRFDAVLAEVNLGGADALAFIQRGLALLEKQASDEGTVPASWIVVTSERPSLWIKDVVAAGVSDFVLKPVDEDVLAAALSVRGPMRPGVNRRAFLRGPLRHIPLASLEGHVIDISEGGVSWVAGWSPDRPVLSIEAPALCEALGLPSTELWVRVRSVTSHASSFYRVGASFVGLDERTRRAIRQRVLSEQLRHPR